MNTTETTETALDCVMASNQLETAETTLDCELTLPRSRKQKNHYCGLVHLLGTIHAQVIPAINAKREALDDGFFRPEDKFIPDRGENYVSLWLGIEHANQG